MMTQHQSHRLESVANGPNGKAFNLARSAGYVPICENRAAILEQLKVVPGDGAGIQIKDERP